MIDKEFEKLVAAVKLHLTDVSSGHDFYHAERVHKNAMHLQSKEGGDKFIIGVSALVHDICRPWEKKTGKSHFGVEALNIIREVLEGVGIDKESIEIILEIVKFHDVYDWTEKNTNKSIELQIVQDADNLDAIGAMGIARVFSFCGAHNLPTYNPGENLRFDTDFVEAPEDRTSAIAHFYQKLLKLKENMNTTTGKELAKERHEVMEKFLEDFFKESEGDFSAEKYS